MLKMMNRAFSETKPARQEEEVRALLRRIYTVPIFIETGRLLFAMARVDRLEPAALWLARRFASLVHWTFGRREQPDARSLAEEWHRLMPEPRRAFPIVRTEGETAFVEIHLRCPLRGTGNAEACWRSMEFDRALVEASGGALVVLESQSVTGGQRCRLAIRTKGSDMSDLDVAHPRWLNPSSTPR